MKKQKNLPGLKSKPSVNPGGDAGEFVILPFSAELKLYHILFEKVAKFLIKRYRSSFSMAFDVFKDIQGLNVADTEIEDLDEFTVNQFYDWMIHTRGIVKTGCTGIEFFMEKAKQVNRAEMIVLGKMNDSLVTLFQVHVSKSGKKLVFEDLLLDYTCETDVEGSSDFPDGSIVAARVITLGGKPTIGLALYPFISEKNILLEMVQEFIVEYQKLMPDSTLESFFKKETPVLLLWFEMMRLMNTEYENEEEEGDEGEEEISEIIVYTALFDVLDYNAVKKRLATIPHVNKFKKDTFEWTGESEDEEEAEVLGMVTITHEKLALITSSRELLEKGKFLLLSVCRDIIRHDRDLEETKYLEEVI